MNLIHRYFYLIVLICFGLVAMSAPAHEIHGATPDMQAWYQNAETVPGSSPRTEHGWVKCCSHAEVVDTKFIVYPDGKDTVPPHEQTLLFQSVSFLRARRRNSGCLSGLQFVAGLKSRSAVVNSGPAM